MNSQNPILCWCRISGDGLDLARNFGSCLLSRSLVRASAVSQVSQRGEKWGTPPGTYGTAKPPPFKTEPQSSFPANCKAPTEGKPLSQGWKTLRHPKSEFF